LRRVQFSSLVVSVKFSEFCINIVQITGSEKNAPGCMLNVCIGPHIDGATALAVSWNDVGNPRLLHIKKNVVRSSVIVPVLHA